jgi:hypothetical protein
VYAWANCKNERCPKENFVVLRHPQQDEFDDDVLNEDWIKYRMVRSHRLLSLVLVAVGVGRTIQKGK